MATLTVLEAAVYAVLRDSGKTFVLSAEVQEWLNEAYLDIVFRTGCLKKTATGTTDANGRITLPSDFMRVSSFWVATEDPAVNESPEPTRDEIFLSHRNNNTVPDATLYRIFDDEIQTYPAVESRSYELEYVYRPTPLSGGSDSPIIPAELHVKLKHYGRAHGKWKEGEDSEGDRYMALYLEGLPRLPDASLRENPGPVDMLPVLGYWDAEL